MEALNDEPTGEWQSYPTGTVTEHWLDLEIRHCPKGEDYPPKEHPPELRASVKYDGCVHLNSYSNGADPEWDEAEYVEENTDYMHICELADHIATLQSLLDKARAHFGSGWPY